MTHRPGSLPRRAPGAANPGELLTDNTTSMTREQAQALAIDLSRRSTPRRGRVLHLPAGR